MTIYIFLAALIGFFSLYPYSHRNSRQSRKIFLILSFLSMTLVLGLRASSVGEDTSMYMNVFVKAQNISWNDIWSNIWGRTTYQILSYGYKDTIESSYLGLCKIIGFFTNNPQVYLFTVSGIICFLFARFIYDNTEHVVFATWVFLCDSMFMFAFNGMRQLLAIGIGLQAYKYIKDKNLIKSAIIIVLAFFIHNTSVVCLLLIPMALIPEDKEGRAFKYILIIAVVMPFAIKAGSALIARFLPRYASYFTTNYWSNSIGGAAILWAIEIGLIFYMYSKKFPTKDSFMLSSLVVFYLALEWMGISITMFSRSSYFYRAFLLLFLPDAISSVRPRYRKLIRIATVVLLFLLYISMARSPARSYAFFF